MSDLMTGRTWYVTADVIFPNHLPVDVDDEGRPQLPQQLKPQSRIPTAHRQMNGAEIFVYETDKQSVPQIRDDLRFALGQIAVRFDSAVADPTAAVQEAMPFMDRVLESLSFQMQTALQIQSVRAIDLSGAPAVGDERDFTQWSGFATPTFRPVSVPMQSLVGRVVPDLSLDLDPEDARANRALNWYLKALTAHFEADSFIFLWIACEILAADGDLKVSEPYRGPQCDHLIEECPQCHAPTTKTVQGRSMKRWLTEGFEVDGDVARRIWKARQMLHGAVAFDSGIMDELPELAQWLRAVVVAEAKRRLGVPDWDPPFAAPTGLTISPHMGVSGQTTVSERDLRPLG
jgi:hypothetical protein